MRKKEFIMFLCMIAGGGVSAVVSDMWDRPFYVQVPAVVIQDAEEDEGAFDQVKVLGEGLLMETENEDSQEAETFSDNLTGEGDMGTGGLSQHSEEVDLSKRLNFAYYYEGEAVGGDASKSHASRVYEGPLKRESSWMSEIYGLRRVSPESMAARLGMDKSAVTGIPHLNGVPAGKAEDAHVIPSWNRFNVTFRNGDRTAVMGHSNIKQILSMASVYGFFHDEQSYDFLYTYASKLWNASHSYKIAVSNVYYCQGECLYGEDDNEDEDEEPEAESNGAAMALPGTEAAREADGTEAVSEPQPESSETAAESEGVFTAHQIDGETADQQTLEETSTAVRETAEIFRRQNDFEPEDVRILKEAEKARKASEAALESGELAKESGSQGMEESSEPLQGSEISSESGQSEETDIESIDAGSAQAVKQETADKKNSDKYCPGHIDLSISVTVMGMDENKGLFNCKAALGESEEHEGWNGWDDTAKDCATFIADQDWYAEYGLTWQESAFIQNPLSGSEVSAYMNLLSPDISPKRREVIRQALLSVGCIPYYWGGKPSKGGYEGNGFGTAVTPDEKGRILRGLDCSGWINWVYWTALGSPLPAESTSGLMGCGRAVAKKDLQAGDILIRAGEHPHVYLFMAWAGDGSMYLIHETTGNVNNVTVGTYDLDLPYYRCLINEE